MKTFLREQLHPALLAGENLVWVDRPEGGIKFRLWDFFLIPFSFAWAVPVIIGPGMILFGDSLDKPPILVIVPLLFSVVGFYITFGRFVHDLMLRNRTVYGISDHGRILIKTGLFRTRFISFEIKNLPKLELKSKSDKSGSLRFEDGGSTYQYRKGYWLGDYTNQFAYIQNAKEVYQLIMQYR